MAKDIEVGAYYRVILRAKEDTTWGKGTLVRGQRVAVEPAQITFILHNRDVESMADAHRLVNEMCPRVHQDMVKFLKTPEAEHETYADDDEIEVLGVEEVLKSEWEYTLYPGQSYGCEPSNLLHIFD